MTLVQVLDAWKRRYSLDKVEALSLGCAIARELDDPMYKHEPMPANIAHKVGVYTYRDAVRRILSERLMGDETELRPGPPRLQQEIDAFALKEVAIPGIIVPCSFCCSKEHRSRKCPEVVKKADAPAPMFQAVPPRQTKAWKNGSKNRRCALCREPGHYARACSRRF